MTGSGEGLLGVALLGAGQAATLHGTVLHDPLLDDPTRPDLQTPDPQPQARLGTAVRVVVSRTIESARALADRFGADAVTFGQLPAVLARPDIAVAVVCGPPATHCAHAVAALAAGARVIVEKPLTATLADADKLLAAAAAAPQRLAYAENHAFLPTFTAARDRLADGAVGRVRHVRVRVGHARPSYGEFLEPAWGGGVLFDLGAHPVWSGLALAGVLTGQRQVTAVRTPRLEAVGGEPGGVDDLARVELDVDGPAGPATVGYEVDWRTPAADSYCNAAVVGDAGRLDIVGYPRPGLQLTRGGADAQELPWPRPAADPRDRMLAWGGYPQQDRAFVAAFRAGSLATPGGADGQLVLQVITAAYAAARSGGTLAAPFGLDPDRTPHAHWRDER